MTTLHLGARLTDATLTPGPGMRVGATSLENGLATWSRSAHSENLNWFRPINIFVNGSRLPCWHWPA